MPAKNDCDFLQITQPDVPSPLFHSGEPSAHRIQAHHNDEPNDIHDSKSEPERNRPRAWRVIRKQKTNIMDGEICRDDCQGMDEIDMKNVIEHRNAAECNKEFSKPSSYLFQRRKKGDCGTERHKQVKKRWRVLFTFDKRKN